jgi:biotin carboxylase
MCNTKKILVLGTGNAQLDLIKYSKQKGHIVVGLSNTSQHSVNQIIDKFYPIDIVDKEKVCTIAQEENVDLIYSIGSDLAMPSIALASQQLGLPCFLSVQCAEIMQNKSLFRKFLNENNICTVPFMKVEKSNELSQWTIFPAIVKPTDSQGQRGIFKVNTPQELQSAFELAKSFSRSETVIIEKYIQGKEISLNGYMADGILRYAFISDRQTTNDKSVGIVAGHHFPTQMPKKFQTKVVLMAQQVATALNYQNGPIYFQMMYNETNVFIIEGTPRLDGCHIWRLIEHRYKINLLNICIEHLLNNILPYKEIAEPENQHDSICFFLEKPGNIFSKEKYENTQTENSYFELYYHNNETVRPVNGILEKVGYQITSSIL